jgi:hypothetical protein
MNAITITYGGTTQSIQDWGFTYCRLRLRSRAASSLILDTAGGNPAADAAIPYGGQIIVQITMGDSSTYTWVGYRRKFSARAWPDAPATSLQFDDVWTDLMLTTFQHYWSMADGSGGLTNKYFSRLNLFQDISAGPGSAWAYLTADAQIKQIVDFAQTQCGLAVQYGEVDPVWNMPVFQVKALSCAECLQLVMKPMPDMVTNIDYSTTLDGEPAPTINFLNRQNCAPVTLPFAGTDSHGRHHKQSDITLRPDLQVPSVVIQYQITGTYDGSNYDDLGIDAYPSGSTGLQKQALVFPVDLRGPSNNIVKATLHTVAIDPTSTTFWKTVKPDLNDPNIVFDATTPIVDTTINGGSGHPDGITILDGAGETVSLSGPDGYPNKLLPSGGNPASWMTYEGDEVEGVPVTIRATLKYTQKDPQTGKVIHKVERGVVETRITLTNAPAGTTIFSTVGSEDSGDPIPTNLAYFMWCSINNIAVNYVDSVATPPETAPSITAPENLQWEGEHQIVEDTIYSIITPANTLNISGGNSDWESMNAAIYAVDYDFFRGCTNIQFGPHKHLQAAEYFEMVMAFRYRSIWNNPALRNNGAQGAGGATDLGSQSPKENTTHQNPQQSAHTVASAPDDDGNVVVAQHDTNTNGGQIVVQTLDTTTPGAVVTSKPQVILSQNDLGALDGVGRIAKWRQFGCCDSSGNALQAWFASTEPEDLA